MKKVKFVSLSVLLLGLHSGVVAAVTTNLPMTVSGGSGMVSTLQTNDAVPYVVDKGNTMLVGGFSWGSGAITSVVLHVKFSVTSYSGSYPIMVNGTATTIEPANGDTNRTATLDLTAGAYSVDTWPEIKSTSIQFQNNSGGSGSVSFDYLYLVINHGASDGFIPPTWSDEFEFSGPPDPAIWTLEEGYKRNNELQYYTTNAWREGGNLVIEGRREQRVDPVKGTMNYTSASIVSTDKFYWQYGRAQIRAKVSNLTGLWPAIWGCGQTGEWPSNGEVDIMENYGSKILGNCARGTTNRWTAAWDTGTRDVVDTLANVEPNWTNSYHIWTMQWDQENVRLYVDNVLVNTIAQSWLVNPVTTWGPLEPFKQPFTLWLNLAIGGNAGGDPSGTPFPQRYYVDYWRIWEGATNNVGPTDIAFSTNSVVEKVPVGTVVGYLSATDADPAEVIRYSFVTGTGDTHNSQFTVQEYISDNTTRSVLKTGVAINYGDGSTRSIRVRATDIEGATYDKVFTITVTPLPYIYLTTNALTIAEGTTGTLSARLLPMPANTVTVNVSRVSGDTNLSVTTGNQLIFTPANGTNWQQVVVAASEDADSAAGSATFLAQDSAGQYTNATFSATEVDNDNLPPVVDAGNDQTVVLGAGSAWTPAHTNTAAWYDAKDAGTVVQSAGAVSQWNDKSGNNRHLVQAVVTNQPSYSVTAWDGSLPALTFDGGSDYLENAATQSQGTVTMAVVMEQADLDNQSRPFGIRGSLTITKSSLAFGCDNSLRYDGAYTAGSIAASTGKHLRVATRTVSNQTDFHDGRTNINSTLTLPNVEGVINAGNTMASLAGHFSSKIAEGFIMYQTIDTSTREKIEGYLAHKWGLAANLPTNHTYKADSPQDTAAIATLNAVVSDPNGNSPATLWTVTSGPAGTVFADATATNTTATFVHPGSYTLRLTADDGLLQSYDEVIINVSTSAVSTCTVIFDGNGGNTPSPMSTSVTYGSTYGTLATVTRAYYIFNGWFTAPSGGSQVTNLTVVSTAGDHTLYAQWYGGMVDPKTPTNALPLTGGSYWTLAFSDEFNTNTLNTTKWGVDVSATSRSARTERGVADWWWTAENVSLDGSNLVLAVTKQDSNTMWCASVSSDGLYEPTYGYLEARIQIANTTKDTHTAFWTQGYNMGNVDGTANDGAEIDIFESPYFDDQASCTVHIDGYGADHVGKGGEWSAPGIHNGYHTFGLDWSPRSMRVYYDGVLKYTYTGTWVVKTNEYLWLSDGCSFSLADIGTFTNEPLGFLTSAKVDYVRVWQTGNYPPLFSSDPIARPTAFTGVAYSNSIASAAVDEDGDVLAYSKESGPSWLTVLSDGTIMGSPTGVNIGTNSWVVRVTDTHGASDTATLKIVVLNPGDPVVLVGGSLLNGDFNANPGGSVLFSATEAWYNTKGGQDQIATRSDYSHDGTQNATLTSVRGFGVDTGYSLVVGDSFDFSYVWKDDWSWVDGSDQVTFSLFITSDNTITGTRTNLVVDYSGLSQGNDTYESVTRTGAYTASASVAGKTLFAAIETTSGGFSRLDNVVLKVRSSVVVTNLNVLYQGNGNTGGSVPVDSTSYTNGSTVTVLGNTNVLVKTGYTFANWNAATNGSGTSYSPGATFTITSNKTLYAQWTEAAKLPATVTLSNLSQAYDTTARAVTYTTSPTNLDVNVTYNGRAIAPTNAGSYAVTGTVVSATHQGLTNGTLVVSKATPTVTTWPTAASIASGQALSNATLTGGSASVPGMFSFDAPGTTPSVGVYTAAVTFAVNDSTNYLNVAGTVAITVIPPPQYILPFHETFDNLALGLLDGQRGWEARDVIVQSGMTYGTSAKAVAMTNESSLIKHTFSDLRSNVWTDVRMRVVYSTAPPMPLAGDTVLCYIATNGMVMAYNGQTPVSTGRTVSEGTWVRLTVNSDYTTDTWTLFVDGRLVGTFAFVTASDGFREFLVNGVNETYVDNIGITVTQPELNLQSTLILLM